MNDMPQEFNEMVTTLCSMQKEYDALDADIRSLRHLILFAMNESGVSEYGTDLGSVKAHPQTQASGYDGKLLGAILPYVIEALVKHNELQLVKEITACYKTKHRSSYITVKLKGGDTA